MPRCAEATCGRWRPERLTPRWAVGLRMNGQWYCSRPCLEIAARTGLDAPEVEAGAAGTSVRTRHLGVLLRQLNAVTDAALAAALESQRTSDRRLGAELVHLGHVRHDQLLRALAAQAGVSYLPTFDVFRIVRTPPWLPPGTVRALQLVPFHRDLTARSVHVLCAAPVPRHAVLALQKLTGLVPEVYLVGDDVWNRAVEVYCAAAEDVTEVEVITSGGIGAAAALVAETASSDRVVTMRHAHWDRFTWVRVEGPSQAANVLVPDSMEATCQAAPTPR